MNLKKAIRLLLIILIIVLFLTILRSTYSKYVTSYDKQTGVGVLGWNIKVNNQKIVDNATFTNNLRVNLEPNEHIADNVIAPTQQGTVDLVLDSTGTQVPYQYEIQIVEGNVDYESTADNVFVDSWLNNGNKIYQINIFSIPLKLDNKPNRVPNEINRVRIITDRLTSIWHLCSKSLHKCLFACINE